MIRSTAMAFITKRIYDLPQPEDGYRLLVMRRWPRGIRRESVDAWERELGPSEALRVAYFHGGMPWKTYAKEYRAEILKRTVLLSWLVDFGKSQNVTLLCSCKDQDYCHRTILKSELNRVSIW